MTPPRRLPTISMTRFFLARRRWDSVIFMLGAFLILLPTDFSAVIFAVFLVVGLYLLAFRTRKAVAHLDTTYVIAAAIFGLSSFAINILNGSLIEDIRWASYPLYYLFVVPIAVGVVLIRDPLRQFVIGVRASLVVVGLWALVDLATGGGRFGMGSNAANAAFAIAFLAVVSRLQIKDAPRLLSDRLVFFYLGLIPILASQTRAVLPVFLIGLLLDLFNLLRQGPSAWRLGGRYTALIWITLLAFVVASGWTSIPRYADRLQVATQEFTDFFNDVDSSTAPGVIIRFTQWKAALELIAEKPLLGRGGAGLREAIIEHSPPHFHEEFRKFTFVHNFILDETLQRGVFGLVLSLGFFGFCFGRIYRRGDASMRESVFLIIVLSISFGMLHYLLVIDRHVALFALYFMLLMTANHGWRQPYRTTAQSVVD